MERPAQTIICPACNKKLTFSKKIAVGRKLRCAYCNEGFRATEELLQSGVAEAVPSKSPVSPQSDSPQSDNLPVSTPQPVQVNGSLVTAIYVASGAVLLAAILFTAPQFLGQKANQQPATAENQPENPLAENSAADSPPANGTRQEPSSAGSETGTSPSESMPSDTNDPNGKNSSSPGSSSQTGPDTPTTSPNKSNDQSSPTEKGSGNVPPPEPDPDRPKDVPPVKNDLAGPGVAPPADPNRPQNADPVVNDVAKVPPVGGIDGLQNLLSTTPPPAQPLVGPIIIVREVPVQAPTPAGPGPGAGAGGAGAGGGAGAAGSGGGSAAASPPAVSVQIQPIGTTITPLVIDSLGNPGLTVNLGINLSNTPTAPITVNLTAPNGVVASNTTLTFPANAAPVQQTVTLTGDGTTITGTPQSQLVFLNVAATGTGLSSTGPAQVPLNLVRRNRFVLFNPLTRQSVTFARGDVLGATNRNIWFAFSNARPFFVFRIGSAPSNPSDYYTENHVEILIPILGSSTGQKIRFTDTQMTFENPRGSGNFQSILPGLTGSWQ